MVQSLTMFDIDHCRVTVIARGSSRVFRTRSVSSVGTEVQMELGMLSNPNTGSRDPMIVSNIRFSCRLEIEVNVVIVARCVLQG